MVYLLGPGFRLIAHAAPAPVVPDGEVGWFPGTGLATLHPYHSPCWSLRIWATLNGAADVLVLFPQGWQCHKYYSNQMLLLGHLKPGRKAGQGGGQGAVVGPRAVPAQSGWLVVEAESLSSSVPAAGWGEAPRRRHQRATTTQRIAAYVSHNFCERTDVSCFALPSFLALPFRRACTSIRKQWIGPSWKKKKKSFRKLSSELYHPRNYLL